MCEDVLQNYYGTIMVKTHTIIINDGGNWKKSRKCKNGVENSCHCSMHALLLHDVNLFMCGITPITFLASCLLKHLYVLFLYDDAHE